jgi:hypothetical protein
MDSKRRERWRDSGTEKGFKVTDGIWSLGDLTGNYEAGRR